MTRTALAELVLSCAPLIAPYPVTAQDMDNSLAGPSAAHLLGTDDLGRDVFSRMVHGGAATLYASGLAVGIGLLLGLPVGLLASLGQMCMTRAYSQGATLVVANLQYSGIVFGALYGMMLFDDQLPLTGWIGMALIVASGILATVLRERATTNAPAEEH